LLLSKAFDALGLLILELRHVLSTLVVIGVPVGARGFDLRDTPSHGAAALHGVTLTTLSLNLEHDLVHEFARLLELVELL
jgi:hypothetical protein